MPETKIVAVNDAIKWHSTTWLVNLVLNYPHVAPLCTAVDAEGDVTFDMVILPNVACWVAIRVEQVDGTTMTLRAHQHGNRETVEVWRAVIPAHLIKRQSPSPDHWIRIEVTPMLILDTERGKSLVYSEVCHLDLRMRNELVMKLHPAVRRILGLDGTYPMTGEERQRKQMELDRKKWSRARSPLSQELQ